MVPEDNGKQNLNESYTTKDQKHVTWTYGHKLVCVDDIFSKSFGEDAVYHFISIMIKESKYCSDMTRKHFKE